MAQNTAFNLTAQLNLAGPNNLRPTVAKIKRELGTIKTDLKLGIDKNAAKNIKNINRDVLALNATLRQTASISKQVATNFNQVASASAKVKQATTQAASGLSSVSSGADDASKNLQEATGYMESFGKQSALAVKRFVAFSAAAAPLYALTRSINRAFEEFVNFDRELTRVVQVTGQSRTALASLTDEITRLSTTLGVSSAELIKVSTTLAQAGLTATQTRTALEALAKASLAPTFDDLTSTVEGSIAAMRQFGITASQLEGALGSINAVAANFAVEAGDIIAAIQRTGGVFAAASNGVSQGTDALNEFIAVFTSVRATTRESAETIATGLRTIFTRIQRGSTIDFLRELGVQLTDAEGKFIGPYKAIQRLSQALRGLDPRDLKFSQIVEELGGFRQIGKVIPLIQQFATAQQALSVAQQGSASLTKDAITAQQSLAVQFSKVREEFLGFVRSIGESRTFKTITSSVLGLASALISVGKAFKPLLPYLALLGTIKGAQAAVSFGKGFLGGGGGGAAGGGGAGGGGSGGGTGGGGTSTQNILNNSTVVSNTAAITANTTALSSNSESVKGLTTAVLNLIRTINTKGPTTGFASGGLVPGTGNSDTVSAQLTPGEYVIRKKAVQTIGVDKLQKMNRYADGGIVEDIEQGGGLTVGAAILEKDKGLGEEGLELKKSDVLEKVQSKDWGKGKFLSKNFPKTIGGTLKFQRKGLSDYTFDAFDDSLDNAIVGAVNSAGSAISEKLGVQINEIAEAQVGEFLKGINSGARGNLFENILLAMKGGPFSERSSGQNFDFPGGLGTVLEKDFEGLPDQWVDAKASFAAAQQAEMKKKTLNEIVSDIEGKKETYLTTAKSNASADEEIKPQTRSLDAVLRSVPEELKTGRYGTTELEKSLGVKKKELFKLGFRQGGSGNKWTYQAPQAKASGGSIQDTVPALLTPGEFVINKKAAQRIGSANLDKLNKADKIQGFNKGGAVGYLQRFAGGGTVDPSLKPAIDLLDANLRGVGALLQDIFVSSEATADQQKEAVQSLQDMITDINKARASGDKDKASELEANLKSELREVISLLAQFKKDNGLTGSAGVTRPGGLGYPGSMQQAPQKPGGLGYPGSMQTVKQSTQQVKQTGRIFGLLNKISPKLAQNLSNLNEKIGGTAATFSLAATTLSTQLPGLYRAIDRAVGGTTLSTSGVAAGIAGGIQQGGASAFAGIQTAQMAGFSGKGVATTAIATAIGGAVSGYLDSKEKKDSENLRRYLQESDARMETLFDRTANENVTEAKREELTQELDKEIYAADQAIGSAMQNSVETWEHYTGRLAEAITGTIITFAALKGALRRSEGGIVYASQGKFINFEPKGTDTVPAMLTPGEFVVNARSTKRHRGVLEAINKSSGGIISPQYFAGGGMTYDEAIAAGYSSSEAMKMNIAYQQSRSADTGGFFENYKRSLSQFYNPFDNSQREGNDRVGSYMRGAGRASMIIGGAAAAGAGAGIAAGAAAGTPLAAMMPTFSAGLSATGGALSSAGSAIATGARTVGSGIATGARTVGSGITRGATGLYNMGGRAIGGLRGMFGAGKAAQGAGSAGSAAAKGGGLFSKLGTAGNILTGGAALGQGALSFFGGSGISAAQQENLARRAENVDKKVRRGSLETRDLSTGDIYDTLNTAGGMEEGALRDRLLTESGRSPIVRGAEETMLTGEGIDIATLERARNKQEADRTDIEKKAIEAAATARNNLFEDAFLKQSQLDPQQKALALKAAQDAKEQGGEDLSRRRDAGEQLTEEQNAIADAYDKVYAVGRKYIANQSEQLLLQERQNRVTQQSTLATENFIAAMNTIEAGMSRASAQFNDSMLQIDNAVGLLEGRIPKVSRATENIFKNISAYSPEEISAASTNLSSSLGFDQMSTGLRAGAGGVQSTTLADTLRDSSLATRALEKDLPRIFRENAGTEDSGEIRSQIMESLQSSGIGEAAARQMADQIINAANKQTSGNRKGASFAKLSEDVPGFLKSVESLKRANELQANLINLINDSLDKYNAKIQEASAKTLEAAKTRADSRRTQADFELNLQQALGRPASLEQMNAGFEAGVREISTVTDQGGNVVAPGTLDPAELQRRSEEAQAELKKLTEQQQAEAFGGDNEALGNAIKTQTDIVNQSNEALRRLAEDGSRAANALSKIQELRQVRENRKGGILEVIRNQDNPDFLRGLQRQAGAVARVQDGKNISAADIKVIAENFDNITGMMDPEQREQFIQDYKKAVKEQAKAGGADQATLDFIENSFNPGSDPAIQRAEAMAREFTDQQIQAQEIIAQRQEKAANVIMEGLPEAAEQFRQIINQAAVEAANELSRQNRATVFGGADIAPRALAAEVVNEANFSELLDVGAANLDTGALRSLLSGETGGLDLGADPALLRQLVDTGAVSGSLEDGTSFKDALAAGNIDDVLARIKEQKFSVNVQPLEEALINNTIKFDADQLRELTEGGGVQVKISGLEALDNANIDLELSAAAQEQLDNFLNELSLYRTETNKPSTLSSGGVVYASNGRIIGMKPKGTDTVPAMLTPGEFVMNKKATQKNLPLLKAINSGAKGYSKGGVAYLADGSSDPIGAIGTTPVKPSKTYEGTNRIVNAGIRSPDGANYFGKDNEEGALAELLDREVLDQLGWGLKDIIDNSKNEKANSIVSKFMSSIPSPLDDKSLIESLLNANDEPAEILAALTKEAYERWASSFKRLTTQFRTDIEYDEKTQTTRADIPTSVVNDLSNLDLGSLEDFKEKPAAQEETPSTATANAQSDAELQKTTQKLKQLPDRRTTLNEFSPDYFDFASYQEWIRSFLNYKVKSLPQGLNFAPNRNRFNLTSFAGATRDSTRYDLLETWQDLLSEIEADANAANLLAEDFQGIADDNIASKISTAAEINKSYNSAIEKAKQWNATGGNAIVSDDGMVDVPGINSDPIDFNFVKAQLQSVGKFIENNLSQLSPEETGFSEDNAKWINSSGAMEIPKEEDKVQAQKQMLDPYDFGGGDNVGKGMSPENQYKRAASYYKEVRGMLARKQQNVPRTQYAATGGSIFKPRGTDTVPAMLTPGEFVVNRRATQKNLGLLHQINNNPGTQYFQSGGRVNYLANGGEGSGGFDFTGFINAVNSFSTSIETFATSVDKIPDLDFGVFKTSVDTMSGAATSLNSSANLFNTAASTLAQNIGNITSAINALASIPSTINLTGSISMPTQLVVTLEGESANVDNSTLVKNVLTKVADGLAQSNSQINVDGIRDQIRV